MNCKQMANTRNNGSRGGRSNNSRVPPRGAANQDTRSGTQSDTGNNQQAEVAAPPAQAVPFALDAATVEAIRQIVVQAIASLGAQGVGPAQTNPTHYSLSC